MANKADAVVTIEMRLVELDAQLRSMEASLQKSFTGLDTHVRNVTGGIKAGLGKAGTEGGKLFEDNFRKSTEGIKSHLADIAKVAFGVFSAEGAMRGMSLLERKFLSIVDTGKENLEIQESLAVGLRQAGLAGVPLENEMARVQKFSEEIGRKFAIAPDQIRAISGQASFLSGKFGDVVDKITTVSAALEKGTQGDFPSAMAVRVFARQTQGAELSDSLGRLAQRMPRLAAELEKTKDPAERLDVAFKFLQPTMKQLEDNAEADLGSIKNLQFGIKEAEEAIGQAVIAAVRPMTGSLLGMAHTLQDDVAPALQSFIEWTAKHSSLIVTFGIAVAGVALSYAIYSTSAAMASAATVRFLTAITTATTGLPGLVLGVGVLITAIYALSHAFTQTAQESLDASRAEEKLIDTQITAEKQAKKSAEGFDVLAKTYGALGGITNRTREQQSEYNSVVLEINSLYPGTIQQGDSFAQNLSSIELASAMARRSIAQYNDEIERLNRSMRDQKQQTLNLKVDVAKENLEKVFGDVTGTIFNKGSEMLFGTSSARRNGERYVSAFADAMYGATNSSEVLAATDAMRAKINGDTQLDKSQKNAILAALYEVTQARLTALQGLDEGLVGTTGRVKDLADQIAELGGQFEAAMKESKKAVTDGEGALVEAVRAYRTAQASGNKEEIRSAKEKYDKVLDYTRAHVHEMKSLEKDLKGVKSLVGDEKSDKKKQQESLHDLDDFLAKERNRSLIGRTKELADDDELYREKFVRLEKFHEKNKGRVFEYANAYVALMDAQGESTARINRKWDDTEDKIRAEFYLKQLSALRSYNISFQQESVAAQNHHADVMIAGIEDEMEKSIAQENQRSIVEVQAINDTADKRRHAFTEAHRMEIARDEQYYKDRDAIETDRQLALQDAAMTHEQNLTKIQKDAADERSLLHEASLAGLQNLNSQFFGWLEERLATSMNKQDKVWVSFFSSILHAFETFVAKYIEDKLKALAEQLATEGDQGTSATPTPVPAPAGAGMGLNIGSILGYATGGIVQADPRGSLAMLHGTEVIAPAQDYLSGFNIIANSISGALRDDFGGIGEHLQGAFQHALIEFGAKQMFGHGFAQGLGGTLLGLEIGNKLNEHAEETENKRLHRRRIESEYTGPDPLSRLMGSAPGAPRYEYEPGYSEPTPTITPTPFSEIIEKQRIAMQPALKRVHKDVTDAMTPAQEAVQNAAENAGDAESRLGQRLQQVGSGAGAAVQSKGKKISPLLGALLGAINPVLGGAVMGLGSAIGFAHGGVGMVGEAHEPEIFAPAKDFSNMAGDLTVQIARNVRGAVEAEIVGRSGILRGGNDERLYNRIDRLGADIQRRETNINTNVHVKGTPEVRGNMFRSVIDADRKNYDAVVG